MVQKITLFLGILTTGFLANGQNPGLLISEFYQNPPGSDSPFEYIELIAVDDIDFSVTPYTVIVCNNGTATADGWISGGALSYAFEITTGLVTVGAVVYVGGTSMAPTSLQVRVIDTGITGGDGGIGNANTGGVVGNGGGNSDGIAVFNLPVSAITSSSIPADAIFYGDGSGPGHGGTIVNGGLDGYELPVNDLYAGGKLQAGSFLALDADLTVATGNFDLTTNTFTIARSFSSGTTTDGTSAITLMSSPPPVVSFVGTHGTYDEAAGTISLDIAITASNAFESTMDIVVRAASTATTGSDFVIGTSAVTFPGSSTTNQTLNIAITDDVIAEESEYIILSFDNLNNAEAGSNYRYFIYIDDNDREIATATNELKFELLTSYSNGIEGTNSAEIVAYDSSNFRLFIANSIGNSLDIVDFSNPSVPVALMSVELDSVGVINSVAAHNGVVALAIQNTDPQQNGMLSFYDGDGNWLNSVDVGAMPDMLTFTEDGSLVIVACEGEPSADYLTDPEGTIAIVDLTNPISSLTNADVTLINFNALDGTETALIAEGIRIFGPGASASQDFEPEYVTVLPDGLTAYVTLQENNALAVIDLATKTLTDVVALGTIDHMQFGNGMDVSNVTSAINIANFPVKGLFLPDAIASLNIDGSDYLFTANEGDLRAYAGFSEETRVKDVDLDPTAFPDAAYLKSDYLLGRLTMTNTLGDTDNDGDFDEIYSISTRSFAIWDASGNLVFDSGDLIEQIIANDPNFAGLFNASNTAGTAQAKNRSDDKGPEVEGITAATIDGNHFAFVSLERVGGVLIFNVNDPANPQFVGYQNNRSAITNGPDRGAEGIIYIDEVSSPNGNALLLLANEISSTVTVFQLNSCYDLSGIEITTQDDMTEFCAYDSILVTADATGSLNYQWYFDGSEIMGETNNETYAFEGGNYNVWFENSTESCSGTTQAIELTELPAPAPTILVNSAVLSTQLFDSYQWYFNGVLIAGATAQEYTPDEDGTYSVIVTNGDGCEGAATHAVNFTAVNENAATAFVIFPNPASEFLNLVLNTDENSMIKMTDVKGGIVFEATGGAFNGTIEIPVHFLAEGFYVISVTTAETVESSVVTIKR